MENWEDYTENEECTAAVAEKGNAFGPIHMDQLLTAAEDYSSSMDEDHMTSSHSLESEKGRIKLPVPERFKILLELGIARNFVIWNGISLEHLEVYPSLIEILQLELINHWTRFKPEVLERLVDAQGISDLPPISADLGFDGLITMLSEKSLCGSPTSLVLNQHILEFAASNESLALPMAEYICESMRSFVDNEALKLIWVNRSNLFLYLVIENKSPKLPNVHKLLYTVRKEVALKTESEAIRSILSMPSSTLDSSIAKYIEGIDSDSFSSNYIANADGWWNDANGLEAISISQFSDSLGEVCEKFGSETCDELKTEFIQMHPIKSADIASLSVPVVHEISHLMSGSFYRTLKHSSKIDDYISLSQPLSWCSLLLLQQDSKYADILDNLLTSFKIYSEKFKSFDFLASAHDDGNTIPCLFAMVEKRQDLKMIGLKQFMNSDRHLPSLNLVRPEHEECDALFATQMTMEALRSGSPKLEDDRLTVVLPNSIDHGGPRRAWITMILSQLTSERSKLLVPVSEDNLLTFKFAWAVDPEIGKLFGFLLGKSLQLGLLLPFEFDPQALALLSDACDEDCISDYYDCAYKADAEFYKQRYLMHCDEENFETCKEFLPLPPRQEVTPTTIHAQSNLFENVNGVKEDIAFSETREYFDAVNENLRDDFIRLVHQFRAGLSLCFYQNYLRFVNDKILLSALFQAKFDHDLFLSTIDLPNNPISVSDGKQVGFDVVFECWVRSLSLKQIGKLVALWTGAPHLDLDSIATDQYGGEEMLTINLHITKKQPTIQMQIEDKPQSISDHSNPTIDARTLIYMQDYRKIYKRTRKCAYSQTSSTLSSSSQCKASDCDDENPLHNQQPSLYNGRTHMITFASCSKEISISLYSPRHPHSQDKQDQYFDFDRLVHALTASLNVETEYFYDF